MTAIDRQDCNFAFAREEKSDLPLLPEKARAGRVGVTQALHIPVSDLPGGRCGLKASRTKTGPLSSRRAVRVDLEQVSFGSLLGEEGRL